MSKRKLTGAAMTEPKDCPTPTYHETHWYCPSCSWTEPREAEATGLDRAIVATFYTLDDWSRVLMAIEAHEAVLVAIGDDVRRRENLPPYGPWPAEEETRTAEGTT